MIRYDREMQALTGRDYPSQNEEELFNKIVKNVRHSMQIGPIDFVVREGYDNDIYNVYYNGRLVFTIRYGTSDAVVYYIGGKWEEIIFKLFDG